MLNGKPLILLTTSSGSIAPAGKPLRQMILTKDYVQAIADAGGIPILAGEMCPEELAELCDGLFLTGGPDVGPALYGETIQSDSVKPDPERDRFETALVKAWMKTGKPVFGICRGCQILNVCLGGTLFQDLEPESGWNHRDWHGHHMVHAEPGTILAKLFGTDFLVNTIHHQAVKVPGRGLKITARSPGGIVEAYEHESLPVFAVQFHPEKMTGQMRDEKTVDFQPLFQYFVEMVRKHAAGNGGR